MIPHDSPLWKSASFDLVADRLGPIPRPSYLPPEVRGTDPLVPEGTDLAIWTWETQEGVPYAIAFAGKAQKPLWYYRFRNDSERDRQIRETTENRRRLLDRKRQELEERRTFQHGLQVGDIFVSSWGYDQTNVDFYEVVSVGDKEVGIREIGHKLVKSERGADYVAATPGHFVGPVLRKRPGGSGSSVYIRLTSFSSARKWDGKPVYQTASGWGH